MPKSIVYVYIAARHDAPDVLLVPGARWVQGEHQSTNKPFKVAAVPRERALLLLERLRKHNALFAPETFRFLFPTLESAVLSAQAYQRKDAS